MIITCKRELTELEKIVETTETFFAEKGIDPSIRYVVDLVTEELFVNLVNYNTKTDKSIEIEMRAEPDGIAVRLTDFDVDRFDPTVHGFVDIKAPLEERTPGGLGIYLVLTMVDSINYNYKDRVSTITFAKHTESRQDV